MSIYKAFKSISVHICLYLSEKYKLVQAGGFYSLEHTAERLKRYRYHISFKYL